MTWNNFLVSHIRLKRCTTVIQLAVTTNITTKSTGMSSRAISSLAASRRAGLYRSLAQCQVPVAYVACDHHRLQARLATTDTRPIDRKQGEKPPRATTPDFAVDTDSGSSANATMVADPYGRKEPTLNKFKSNQWQWIPSVTDSDREQGHMRSDARPADAPDANDLQSRPPVADAESRTDFEHIRSVNDKANYSAPKRLSSLKDAVGADLEAAREKFDEVKDQVASLPDKAKSLEHKIEEKGHRLAQKIKNFVSRDK